MKKLIILLILILTVPSVYCQGKIYIGINISPSLSYAVVPGFSSYFEEKSDFSFGISGMYFFNSNLFLKSSFIFNQKSFALNGIPNTTRTLNDIEVYDDYPTFDDTETYQSFVLPLIINYRFSNLNKTSFLIAGGIELGYLFNIKYVYDYSSGEQKTYNRNQNDFIGAINFGVGLFQPFSDNYLLLITPSYSYSFYPDHGDKSLNFHSIYLDIDFYFKIM
jgi:hypothetical protein